MHIYHTNVNIWEMRLYLHPAYIKITEFMPSTYQHGLHMTSIIPFCLALVIQSTLVCATRADILTKSFNVPRFVFSAPASGPVCPCVFLVLSAVYTSNGSYNVQSAGPVSGRQFAPLTAHPSAVNHLLVCSLLL